MDSGIDDTHEDFTGRIIGTAAPFLNHGTHVAGKVAGGGQRSDDEGGQPQMQPPQAVSQVLAARRR